MSEGVKKSIQNYLKSRLDTQKVLSLKDLPTPESFANINKASQRVLKAINSGELITIVGDYDVDGVVASVILSEFLEAHKARLEVIIPHRVDDGYGVSEKIVERSKGTLIITVDNGIVALDAALKARELGKDIIITDHHTPQEKLPEAFAIINPKLQECHYPYKDICGAQVAWYFCGSIKKHLNSNFPMGSFLDLLSIAILADVMPLVNVNRVSVKRGFLAIKSSKRAALEVFKEEAGDRFGYEDLSFLLIPLLNSAGRLDSAMESYKFLKAKRRDVAKKQYDKLKAYNENRKDIQNSIFKEATAFHQEDQPMIVAYGQGWHEGVVGVVSSKLTQKYEKASFVFSIKDGVAKGSARSCGRIDIFNTIMPLKSELLRFGGHAKAAGLSMREDMLPSFAIKVQDSVAYLQGDGEFEADFEIDLDIVDIELVDILQSYEPFGEGNPKLKFLSQNLIVESIRKIGKDGRSYILELRQKREKKKVFLFNSEDLSLQNGDKISCIYDIGVSYYNKIVEPKIIINKIIF